MPEQEILLIHEVMMMMMMMVIVTQSQTAECRALKTKCSSRISSTFEAQNLLVCTAVFLIECRRTFQRYVLASSSGTCLHHHPDDGGSTYL
jgi:hypothetical protein